MQKIATTSAVTRAHVITLVLISLTSLVTLAGSYWLSRDDDVLPRLINMAGNQRALTRQISFLQYQLSASPQTNVTELQRELRTLAEEFENNHAMLTGQQRLEGRAIPATQSIRQYYTSHLLSLNERATRFAKRAKRMASLPASALSGFIIPGRPEIDGLYDRLDGAVSVFERLHSEKARQHSLWLMACAGIVIMVILASWLFVLRPAQRRVANALATQSEDIAQLRAHAQRSSTSLEAKSQFITTISHEFRSPISAIVGALELIPNMRDKQDVLVQQAEQACYRLLTLSNNLLDIMDTDQVGHSAEQASFDLPALLDECIAPFSAPSRTKQLEFGMKCETAIPPFVRGNAEAIKKALINVLDNAVKFTSDGFVSVYVSCRVVNKRFALSIKVVDSGIGIKERDQQHIFDRFFRVDAPGYQQYAGAGVGLTVAKKHVSQAGGDIYLASQPGIGSEFTLEFPLQQSEQSESPRVVSSAVSFAVIDDLEISRLHVGNVIRREGFNVHCFASASEFLAQHNDITAYSAIIADFYMPGINGMELASTVSAMLGKRTPPVIMMSATPDIANIMANGDVGVWQAFVKPVDIRRLTDSLHQLAGQRINQLRTLDRARVLIVEDEPINADIIKHMVHCMGHQSVVVHNGEDALQQLDTEPFDAVLLDINLPDVHGTEIAAIAREKALTMPIIAVTANAFAADKAATQRAGIRYHLVKPVTYQELKNTLQLSLTC